MPGVSWGPFIWSEVVRARRVTLPAELTLATVHLSWTLCQSQWRLGQSGPESLHYPCPAERASLVLTKSIATSGNEIASCQKALLAYALIDWHGWPSWAHSALCLSVDIFSLYISYWRRDRHFTWSSEPPEGVAISWQRPYNQFPFSLSPWVLVRPRENRARGLPLCKTSVLPAELILPRSDKSVFMEKRWHGKEGDPTITKGWLS